MTDHVLVEDSIAVVGMACRLPGGIDSPESLWRSLIETRDAAAGVVVGEPDGFDPEFFGISLPDAEAMDPRLRLALETGWQALEYAGIDPATLRDSDTGVYLGAPGGDYARVATILGFRGPALSIDTAGSAALVAVHLAARAIAAGDCSLALIGGADGPHEGVAVLVLARLSEAHRRGYQVLAVLRGSAVKHEGAAGPGAQEGPIRAALANAELAAAGIDVVAGPETGSAAAGLAGVLTTIQAIRHGLVPPTVAAAPAVPWPEHDRPRRAAVAVFGVSGTNAHVILEQAPPGPPLTPVDPTRRVPLTVWPFSARTPEALAEQAARLADHVRAHPEFTAREVGHALTTTRTVFDHRAAVLGRNRIDLLAGLAAVAEGKPVGPIRGLAADRRVVFVFPGQGQQYQGMAAQLLAESPVFAAEIAACEAALSEFVDWSLTDVLTEAEGAPSLEHVDVVQPALFATMVSLAALWRSFGIEPAAVLGHSQGEVAAAYVAGALTLSDAARIVALRSRLLRELDGTGGMASVNAPVARVREFMAGIDDLHVAAVNSPTATVVAGGVDGVARMLEVCERAAVRARRIPADCAGHTAHVDVLRERLDAAVAPITARATGITFFSTVTGGVLGGEQLGPDYWFRNLRAAVSFEAGFQAAAESGYNAFLEMSANPVLTAAMHESLGAAADSCLVTGSLRRDDAGIRRLLASVSEAHVGGVSPQWSTIYPVGSARPIQLPTYAFQHRTYSTAGVAETGGEEPGDLGLAAAGHPLLGAVAEVPGADRFQFVTRTSRATRGWIADHALRGTAALPAAALVELAFHVGGRLGVPRVRKLTMHEPVTLPTAGAVDLQVVVGELGESGQRTVAVFSSPEDADAPLGQRHWTRHADGVLTSGSRTADTDTHGLTVWPPVGATPGLEPGPVYETLAALGYRYGPAFQGVRRIWHRGDEIFAEVALPDSVADADNYGLHPALLDAALQPVFAAATPLQADGIRLPVMWEDVELRAVGAKTLRVRLTSAGTDRFRWALGDGTGRIIAEGTVGMGVVAPTERAAGGSARRNALYSVDWLTVQAWRGRYATRQGEWAIVGKTPFGARGEAGPARYTDLEALYTAVDSGAETPSVVVWSRVASATVVEPGTNQPRALRDELALMLRQLQTWLAAPPFADTKLLILTRGVQAAEADEDVSDLVGASVWALVRTAQWEHPHRIVQVDLDEAGVSLDQIATVLRLDEPELALRRGEFLARRLRSGIDPVATQDPGFTGSGPSAFDPDRTVLITGGTGKIGGIIARHLVSAYGARHLLLTSRSGGNADGIAELTAELGAQGAEVTVAVCDAGDHDALAEAIDGVPAAHPVGAVVHLAATLADATFAALTEAQLDAVLPAKANGAWHLHELTQHLDLSMFVLFSSSAGAFGWAGQANYTAANVFLDSLARYRHRRGLPATAMAWGWWAEDTSNTGGLDDKGRARLGRMGLTPMPTAAAMELFDAALGTGQPYVLPIGLDLTRLTAAEPTGEPAPLFRALAPARPQAAQQAGDSTELAARMAGLGPAERHQAMTDLLKTPVSIVLGYATPDAVQPDRPFAEMGLDSLSSIELGARLRAMTGVKLGNAVIYQHPTVRLLAKHVLDQVTPRAAELAAPIVAEVELLLERLSEIYEGGPIPDALLARLTGVIDAQSMRTPA
ncbi:type I polyketide synthase [Nocardia sp. NPDC004860]|uniref:type I polyketide synthase n=1 Tax=Nocardia sp. NPDC004860 TaxID=3154557 RepID=UPI00339FA1D6